MGRLIDDEAIFKAIESHSYLVAQRNNSVECGMTLNGIKQVIDEQPTAFDVDKVIKQMKNEFKKYYGENFDKAPYLVNAIEIVKRGGIE